MGFNISKDQKYIQFETMILDTQSGFKFDIETAHPAIVCEIFKQQCSYHYKNKLMETNDLFLKMKQLLYPLMSFDKDLVSEYEVRYGMNLIYESSNEYSSTTNRLIEESWDFVKSKILSVIPITIGDIIEEGNWFMDKVNQATDWVGDKAGQAASWVKDKAGQAVDWVGDKLKQAAQWVLNKGLPWFFGKLESFLLSPVGIGVDVALTALGVGKIATTLVWGALGVWKIYQLFSGQIPNDIWSYLDIAMCLIGLVFTGGAAKALKVGISGLGKNVAKLAKSPVIKPILQLVGKGLSFISSAILKPIEWLAKTLGGPKIQQVVASAKANIAKVFDNLANIGKGGSTTASVGKQTSTVSKIKQGIKSDIVDPAKAALKNPALLKKAGMKGVTWGLATHGTLKGIEKGAQWYANREAEKNSEMVNQAIAQIGSDDNMVQQTVSTSMDDALAQMSALDNQ